MIQFTMVDYFQKLFFLLVFSTCFFQIHAQKKAGTYRQQFLLISENDSYTLKLIDRYYTDGIAVCFSKALKTEQKKKLFNAELGQAIFTGYDTRKNYYSNSLDRPYSGFLYIKGGLSYLYKNENNLSWNAIAGVTGKAAKGEQTQRFIHHLLGFNKPYGWETQLNSEFGFNIQTSYSQHLFKTPAKKSFDTFGVSDAIIGTSFTRFAAGVLFRLGAIEPAYNSAWFNGRLASSNENQFTRPYELFFYFEPSIIAQVYDATVQGGLFTGQDGKFTSQLVPFIYQHKFGGVYAKNRWTTQIGFNYRTKQARTMITNEVYGTIAIGYRF